MKDFCYAFPSRPRSCIGGCTKKELRETSSCATLPFLALCLLLTGAGIGYYNWKLTGRLWLLPYQLHERTYVVSPLFIYQKPRPQPAYRPPAMRDFYLSFDLPHYQETQSARGLIASWYDRSKKFWRVLLGPLLTLPLLLAPLTMFRNWR